MKEEELICSWVSHVLDTEIEVGDLKRIEIYNELTEKLSLVEDRASVANAKVVVDLFWKVYSGQSEVLDLAVKEWIDSDKINRFIEFFGECKLKEALPWYKHDFNISERIIKLVYLFLINKVSNMIGAYNSRLQKLEQDIEQVWERMHQIELEATDIEALNYIHEFNKDTKCKFWEESIHLKIQQNEMKALFKMYNIDEVLKPLDKIQLRVSELEEYELKMSLKFTNRINNKLHEYETELHAKLNIIDKTLSLVEDDLYNENNLKDLEQLETLNSYLAQIVNTKIKDDILLNLFSTAGINSINIAKYNEKCNLNLRKIGHLLKILESNIEAQKTNKAEYEGNKYLIQLARKSKGTEYDLETHKAVRQNIERHFHLSSKVVNPIKVLFDLCDKSKKGYLTKSEFKKAFKIAYPSTKDSDGDEVFEMSYETVGKLRRGIEFIEFNAIIQLGMTNELGTVENILQTEGTIVDVQDDMFTDLCGPWPPLSMQAASPIHLHRDSLENVLSEFERVCLQ